MSAKKQPISRLFQTVNQGSRWVPLFKKKLWKSRDTASLSRQSESLQACEGVLCAVGAGGHVRVPQHEDGCDVAGKKLSIVVFTSIQI